MEGMKMANVQNLTKLLEDATKNRYAVGSFSARYTKLIRPIIKAAINTNSPAIVQLSEKEVIRHKVGVKEFADEFYRVVEELDPKVPLALHLDHTKTLDVIREAMDAGFTSVMIDSYEMDYADNVAVTKEVVAMAHPRNITVEAELGKVGGKEDDLDGGDDNPYTDPNQAVEFVKRTGVNSLAVAIGTAHGVYKGEPKLDLDRLSEIRKVVDIPLVLHGTSGVPDETVTECVNRGICKVNYATDLRIAFTKGVEAVFEENPDVIDPKKYNAKGKEYVKEYVMSKMRVVKSVGKAE